MTKTTKKSKQGRKSQRTPQQRRQQRKNSRKNIKKVECPPWSKYCQTSQERRMDYERERREKEKEEKKREKIQLEYDLNRGSNCEDARSPNSWSVIKEGGEEVEGGFSDKEVKGGKDGKDGKGGRGGGKDKGKESDECKTSDAEKEIIQFCRENPDASIRITPKPGQTQIKIGKLFRTVTGYDENATFTSGLGNIANTWIAPSFTVPTSMMFAL